MGPSFSLVSLLLFVVYLVVLYFVVYLAASRAFRKNALREEDRARRLGEAEGDSGSSRVNKQEPRQ